MTAFQRWLGERINEAGGFSAFTQKTGITSGRIYGWRRGALPQDREAIEALAVTVGEDVQHLRELVWQSQGTDTSASTWKSARLPLAKADRAPDRAPEPVIPAGAKRLARMIPAHA